MLSRACSYRPSKPPGYLDLLEAGPDELRALVERYPGCLDARDSLLQQTVLHEHAYRGDMGAVRTLHALRAPLEALDVDRRTPLHRAAQAGHAILVQWFLEQGADPLRRACNGFTALHYGAYFGRLEVVDVLLRHGVPPDAGCVDNQSTPLHTLVCADPSSMPNLAKIERKRRRVSPLVLRRLSETFEREYDPATGVQIARLLLDSGADVNSHDGCHSVLDSAVLLSEHNTELLLLLVERGGRLTRATPWNAAFLQRFRFAIRARDKSR